jgi:hypothetical protein
MIDHLGLFAAHELAECRLGLAEQIESLDPGFLSQMLELLRPAARG